MLLRSQSAIEFLMTYGWAILSIVVAMGVIYSLGIFNLVGSGGTATGCSVLAGFSCTQPVLYSSGSLTASIGQVGQTKTITAVGCSANQTEPTTWEGTSITLQSGQVGMLDFQCPGVQGRQLGSTYQGTLWVQYYAPAQGSGATVVQEVGTVKATVAGSGVPGIPSGSNYIQVTMNNAQGQGTPAPFQQMVTFNPSQYSQYEASDLGNIRFYEGGQELYSWCESGCGSSSSSSTFWVSIPGGIPASGNSVVYMVFAYNTPEYDGIYAGEAPQLTSPYAKYDNGASVFPLFYSNFEGNTLSGAKWTCISTCNAITVSNILTIQDSNTLGPIEASATNLQMSGTVTDAYVLFSDPTPCSGFSCLEEVRLYLGESALAWEYQATPWSWCPNGAVMCPYPMASAYITTQQLSAGTWGVISTSDVNASGGFNNYGQLNYGDWTGNPYSCNSHSCSNEIFFDVRMSNVTVHMQWVRLRAYPPSGAMPSVSFGSVAGS
ncbi:MAG: hypothetical protein KGH94_04515 [Candidatus Micrarchaeota archaeon]|nr:hypothetical protein [Candidatus Micrarchaeota archaeon]